VKNDVMTAVLNLWRHTPSIAAYLLEEHSCRIPSRSDLKRRSLGFFVKSVAHTRARTTRRRTTKWV